PGLVPGLAYAIAGRGEHDGGRAEPRLEESVLALSQSLGVGEDPVQLFLQSGNDRDSGPFSRGHIPFRGNRRPREPEPPRPAFAAARAGARPWRHRRTCGDVTFERLPKEPAAGGPLSEPRRCRTRPRSAESNGEA